MSTPKNLNVQITAAGIIVSRLFLCFPCPRKGISHGVISVNVARIANIISRSETGQTRSSF